MRHRVDTPADLIGIVEKAYYLGPDEEWLTLMAEAVRPFFDRGLGVVAYDYLAAPGLPVETRTVAYLGSQRAMPVAVRKLNRSVPAPLVDRTYRARTGCATTSEMSGLGAGLPRQDIWAESMLPLGAYDYFGVNAILDPGGMGVNIGAPLPTVEQTNATVRGRWSRVASHLAAGLRLRRALAGVTGTEGAEAVLTPDGKVEHAEPAAQPLSLRKALRDAAARLDRARGRLRQDDSDQALDLWSGLVAGRWSLVDHFERGGRRYLVARRNDPNITDPRGLTTRERQVAWYAALGHANKLIAYELGLAPTTVAVHLSRAMTKLAVKTRVELIALVSAFGARESP